MCNLDVMEFSKDFGKLSTEIFAERSHILHWRHTEQIGQVNVGSIKLQETLLKELLLQLDYVRDVIKQLNTVRKLCNKRKELYEQFRTAQRRYDEANGDFKGASGPSALLVIEKYKE